MHMLYKLNVQLMWISVLLFMYMVIFQLMWIHIKFCFVHNKLKAEIACFVMQRPNYYDMAFHLTCVHIILCSVWVAEWPPFGKKSFSL